MDKCRAVTNDFEIWAKQEKHTFKSRGVPAHSGIEGEQRRKTISLRAHRSPNSWVSCP